MNSEKETTGTETTPPATPPANEPEKKPEEGAPAAGESNAPEGKEGEEAGEE